MTESDLIVHALFLLGVALAASASLTLAFCSGAL
jgi:hypothetical protein